METRRRLTRFGHRYTDRLHLLNCTLIAIIKMDANQDGVQLQDGPPMHFSSRQRQSSHWKPFSLTEHSRWVRKAGLDKQAILSAVPSAEAIQTFSHQWHLRFYIVLQAQRWPLQPGPGFLAPNSAGASSQGRNPAHKITFCQYSLGFVPNIPAQANFCVGFCSDPHVAGASRGLNGKISKSSHGKQWLGEKHDKPTKFPLPRAPQPKATICRIQRNLIRVSSKASGQPISQARKEGVSLHANLTLASASAAQHERLTRTFLIVIRMKRLSRPALRATIRSKRSLSAMGMLWVVPESTFANNLLPPLLTCAGFALPAMRSAT